MPGLNRNPIRSEWRENAGEAQLGDLAAGSSQNKGPSSCHSREAFRPEGINGLGEGYLNPRSGFPAESRSSQPGRQPVWVTGMVSGRGWTAVAFVTFSRWNTLRAIGAAPLFGAVQAVIPLILSSGLHVPIYLIQMSPYVATIVVLGASGVGQMHLSAHPEDLARPFLREERR
jgi:hypothetical protein